MPYTVDELKRIILPVAQSYGVAGAALPVCDRYQKLAGEKPVFSRILSKYEE